MAAVSSDRIALITGANRRLDREAASQLAGLGTHGARLPDTVTRAPAAEDLLVSPS